MALTKIGKEGITGVSNSADANAITISSAEKVTLTQQIAAKAPSFRAYMSAGQTFTTSTVTVAAFNTEVWDSNSNYDTSTYRFTPTVAGYYHFTAQIFCGVSSGRAMVGFRKNGNSDTETFHVGSNLTGGVDYQSDTIIQLNGSTDYVEAVFYQEQGSDATCNNNIALTNFAGHLLMAT